jgi:hypothetical protein
MTEQVPYISFFSYPWIVEFEIGQPLCTLSSSDNFFSASSKASAVAVNALLLLADHEQGVLIYFIICSQFFYPITLITATLPFLTMQTDTPGICQSVKACSHKYQDCL